METTPTLMESIIERTESLGKTTYELSRLKALETTSQVITILVSRLIVFLVLSMFLLVFSIGMSFLLGEWLDKPYYGFFIVGGLYLVLSLILHLVLSKWLKNPVINLLIPEQL